MELYQISGGQDGHKGGALWHKDSAAEADPKHRAAAGSVSKEVLISSM